MRQILVLTMNPHLELGMRLSAMAEGVGCHANTQVEDIDAILVDLDELQPELADLARHYATLNVPVLAVAQEPTLADASDVHVDLCLAKPVETTRLVYVMRQLISVGGLSADDRSQQAWPRAASGDGGSPERP